MARKGLEFTVASLWNSPAWLLTWLAASLACYCLEEAALHLSEILHPSSTHPLPTVLPSSYLPHPKHCFAYLLIVCVSLPEWRSAACGGAITVPTVSARPVVVLASTQQAFRTYELNDEGNKP